MGQKSTIAKLPEDMRRFIADRHAEGLTIEEVCEALFDAFEIAIPRSTMGRHLKKLDVVAEQMLRSRQMAEALAQRTDDKNSSDLVRMNLEIMHNIIFKASMAEDGEFLNLPAADVMMLASAARNLTSAEKQITDLDLAARKRLSAELKEKLAEEAKAGRGKVGDQDILARIEELVLKP